MPDHNMVQNRGHQSGVDTVPEGERLFQHSLDFFQLFPRKPAPDGALYLAGQFGAAPEECLYVGDTGTDMKTGRAAGMYTVGVLWGFRDREELERDGADCVIADARELVDIYGRENREK